MAGTQIMDGEGVKRGVLFNVDPAQLTYDVEKDHPLYETDRERVTVIDESLVLSIMAVGVQVPIKVSVESDPKRYVVADGRRRVFNALEANKRLRKIKEPEVTVPVTVVKADEKKLSEIMISLNELRVEHAVMAKAEKAARFMARVNGDVATVARAFGVQPQTIGTWVRLASLSTKVKRLIEDGKIAPSAAEQFAGMAPAAQLTAVEEFMQTAVESGVKPTAVLAAATLKQRKTPAVEGEEKPTAVLPSRRTLRQLVSRSDINEHLDPNVIKTIRWLSGELSANSIAGLSKALKTLTEEREEKIAKKAERKQIREANKQKRAERAAASA